MCNTDGIRKTALQDIIGVDQKDTCVRINLSICLESFILRGEELDPAVCHGSYRFDAELLVSQHRGCGIYTTDKAGSGSPDRRIRSLGPACTKLHNNRISGTCRTGDPVCFCSDQRLEIDADQKHGLQQLRFDDRSGHGNDRRIRIYDSSFRNCLDGSGKFEVRQILKEALIKHVASAEICDIILGKMQTLHIIDQHAKSCTDNKAAAVRILAVEHIENRNLVLISRYEITVCHGQFVVIH